MRPRRQSLAAAAVRRIVFCEHLGQRRSRRARWRCCRREPPCGPVPIHMGFSGHPVLRLDRQQGPLPARLMVHEPGIAFSAGCWGRRARARAHGLGRQPAPCSKPACRPSLRLRGLALAAATLAPGGASTAVAVADPSRCRNRRRPELEGTVGAGNTAAATLAGGSGRRGGWGWRSPGRLPPPGCWQEPSRTFRGAARV
jgi:hypothetical protein